MESDKESGLTPRRSLRIRKLRDTTPEPVYRESLETPQTKNRSKRSASKPKAVSTATTATNIPEVNLIRPSIGGRNSTEKLLAPSPTVKKPVSEPSEIPEIQAAAPSQDNHANEILHSAEQMVEDVNDHGDALLMDESIMTVPESPIAPQQRARDSTFSPVVDTSIHDSRPIIDAVSEPRSVTLRTSTPLARNVFQFGAKGLTPRRTLAVTSAEPSSDFLEELKSCNPLEKSILKSTRRKRSLSVTEAENLMMKRVMFRSPQVIEIGKIDEKMMASFMEEKETTMMREAASSARRKRSLSTGTPVRALIGTPGKSKERSLARRKIPDFAAIHERQFGKMESIEEHHARKVERAKKLATGEPSRANQLHGSKIPTRKPLSTVPSTENVVTTRRAFKRSLSTSDELPKKKLNIAALDPFAAGPSKSNSAKKVAAVAPLERTKSEVIKPSSSWAPLTATCSSSSLRDHQPSSQNLTQMKRTKVEERRERNMGLYKTNDLQRSASDFRTRNANILKGVRLNRRFDLQMQHRQAQEKRTEES